MKRSLYIIALLVASLCHAQQQMPQVDTSCEGWFPGLPDHYCECRTASQEFRFPLEVEIGGTPVWFSTTYNDLKQGVSAYWFSTDTVRFEVYAFCASEIPTFTMSVVPNQMREMDIDEINKKLEAASTQAELLNQLTPRVRVYTVHGRTGSAYCYHYDEGPASTCDAYIHLFPKMIHVCEHAEQVFVLQPSKISSQGIGFLQWKQKKNLPATIRLTKDSCNGPEISQFTLADSMRVHVLNAATMKALKNAGDSIYVHVSHDSSYVGRLIYRNTIKWDSQVIDTTICQGMVLQLGDTALSETTEYGGDTLLKKADSLYLTGYRLTVIPPEYQYDTLRLRNAQLPYSYRNQIIPQGGWGDYDFTIHQAGRCDERYMVHVEHDFVTQNMQIDTTICSGKKITINDIAYITDTVVQDSAWVSRNTGPDVWMVRDITIHFSEPEPEYDTIAVPPSRMTSRGYYYSALGAMVTYGDTTIVKKSNNACTRLIFLTVIEGEETVTGIEDVTYTERAYKYLRDGMLYIRRGETNYDLLGRPINRNTKR